MSWVRIAPIVEGHGEVIAVCRLLERVWHEIAMGDSIDVLQAVRSPRTKLIKHDPTTGRYELQHDEVARSIELARRKLDDRETPKEAGLVLLLYAHEGCPKELSNDLNDTVSRSARPWGTSVVFANVEYETWFVASAASLSGFLRLTEIDQQLVDVESRRLGKKWIEEGFKGAKYRETADQVRLTSVMDLKLCRDAWPSFDKLCRALESQRHTNPNSDDSALGGS